MKYAVSFGSFSNGTWTKTDAPVVVDHVTMNGQKTARVDLHLIDEATGRIITTKAIGPTATLLMNLRVTDENGEIRGLRSGDVINADLPEVSVRGTGTYQSQRYGGVMMASEYAKAPFFNFKIEEGQAIAVARRGVKAESQHGVRMSSK